MSSKTDEMHKYKMTSWAPRRGARGGIYPPLDFHILIFEFRMIL